MKNGLKSVPVSLTFSAQKSTVSFQGFALIRTIQGRLSPPSLQRVQSAGQGLDTFKALRIDAVPESNLSGGFGVDVSSARNTNISTRAKELRVRWVTKPPQIIEVTDLQEL